MYPTDYDHPPHTHTTQTNRTPETIRARIKTLRTMKKGKPLTETQQEIVAAVPITKVKWTDTLLAKL